jgi:hypothetical protein
LISLFSIEAPGSWVQLLSLLELLELLELSELLELLAVSELLEELSLPETFFFFPDLKSVSYHPAPFRRNPAADILFLSESFSHFGQVTNGASLSFCTASSSWPQFSQRYSYIGI